jgi:hypothetical protein
MPWRRASHCPHGADDPTPATALDALATVRAWTDQLDDIGRRLAHSAVATESRPERRRRVLHISGDVKSREVV